MRKTKYCFRVSAAMWLVLGLLALISISALAVTPPGTQITTSATARYSSSTGESMPTATSNTVTTTVGQLSGVSVTPTTGSKTADRGQTAVFPLTVTNQGGVSDTIGLTTSSMNGWTAAIYRDVNGDGVWQSTETTQAASTGALASGAQFKCLVVVTVPASGTQTSDSVTFTARSGVDATKTATATLTVQVSGAAVGPYIQSWLLNGYYSADRTVRMSTDFLGGESAVAPIEGAVSGGKPWFIASSTDKYTDLSKAFGAVGGCAVYAFAYVYSPTAQSANLWMGSDDGLKVWLNGTVVWNNDAYRSYIADQDKAPINLAAGWNRLLVKITQGGGGWGFSLKVCDSSGNAVSGLLYDTKPAADSDTTPPRISNVKVTVGTTTAKIEWDTDEPSSTQVDYGTTTSLDEKALDVTMATHHTATLSSLTASTTYYYWVTSTDAAGNAASKDGPTFKTLDETPTPPPDDPPPAPAPGPYVQSWLLNGYYPAASTVRMATDFLGGESAVTPSEGAVSGGKTWTRWASADKYVDLSKAFGSVGGCVAYAAVYVYSPNAQPANLWMGSDDGLKVWLNGTVVWTKDVYRSYIADQDKAPINLSAGWNRLLVKITQGGGGWGFSLKVCDSSGNAISGLAYDIKPEAVSDTTPPRISNVKVTVTTTTAKVEWDTDEPSSTQVDYGTSDALGAKYLDVTAATHHTATLSGLTASTTYYYWVTSTDAAGNAASKDGPTFKTLDETPTPPPPDDPPPAPSSGPYIQSWLLNGYYTAGSTVRMATDFLGGESAAAPVEGAASGGKTWFKTTSTDKYIDLGKAFGNPGGCVAYAAAYIYSPTARSANLWMGSDDGLKVWLNGTVVWIRDVYRGYYADQDRTPINLSAGWNRLLVKITQGGGGWGFSLKVCDSLGNQIPGLAYATAPATDSDTTAPQISGIKVTVSSTSATIEWDTNEPSSTLVDYGTTTSLGQDFTDSVMATHHTATLSGLTADTTYYFNVGSADAAGNTSWADGTPFKTASGGSGTPAVGAYLQTWLLNGIYYADRSIRMGADYLGGESTIAPFEGAVSGGKTWVRWDSTDKYVDLGRAYNYPGGCVAYAAVYLYSPSARSASLWMGSDDGLKVWVNGAVVWNNDTYRSYLPDQDKAPINLAAGWNRILVKVTQGGSGWGFSVKVCDSYGNAIPGLGYALSPQ